MLTLAFKTADDVTVYTRGCAASLAMAHFMAQRRNVGLISILDPTDEGTVPRLKTIYAFASKYGMAVHIRLVADPSPSSEKALRILMEEQGEVVLATNLQDMTRTWVRSVSIGVPALPRLRKFNISQPWVLNSQEDILSYCQENDIDFVAEDVSESDRLADNAIDTLTLVNPGFEQSIRSKLLNKSKNR